MRAKQTRVYWIFMYMLDTSICNGGAEKFFAISNVTGAPSIATRFACRRAPEFIDYMMDFLVKKFRGWLIDGSRKCYMSIDVGVVEDWGGWDAGEFVEDEMIDEITVVEGGKWFCKR